MYQTILRVRACTCVCVCAYNYTFVSFIKGAIILDVQPAQRFFRKASIICQLNHQFELTVYLEFK